MDAYDLVGYIGLGLNLYSMYTRGEYKLRLFSIIANAIYIIYGILLSAMPIVIGCTIAIILHVYRLKKIKTIDNAEHSKSNNS